MLDPKYIREHADAVAKNCVARRADVDVKAFLKVDAQRAALIQETEALRAERNATAERMKSVGKDGNRDELIAHGKALKEKIAEAEGRLEKTEGEWRQFLLQFPNMTHPKSPKGDSDADNKEVRKVGKVKKLKKPLTHVELAEKYDLIDFVRGAKVAGAKFYFLKGKVALLEQALVRYAMDHLVREGFIPLVTPDLAKDEVLIGTGYQPRGPETQIYSIEGTDLSLVGTAEIAVGGYHKDEILTEKQLPLKYVALSHCFRTEAGAYGKESYGLYRVHQFTKVEMFAFTTPEQSDAVHEEMIRHEEDLFRGLDIPFRVVDICTGDLGGPAYRKYDIEAWMWGRNDGKGDWGEVTSASNCTDFQARRLNIRYRKDDGTVQLVHTLNGTALAMSRALIALLENGQQDDGTIRIPDALVPYCGFDTIG